jgi:hypothetical protein
MKTAVPIILDQNILTLSPRFFFMGGGHIDTKVACLVCLLFLSFIILLLSVQVDEFLEVMHPIVAQLTVPRPPDYDGLGDDMDGAEDVTGDPAKETDQDD